MYLQETGGYNFRCISFLFLFVNIVSPEKVMKAALKFVKVVF